MHMDSHTDIHMFVLSIYIVFFGKITRLYYVAFLQGLITFLVNENGFNSDRVTKVCRALNSIIMNCLSRISIASSERFK